MLQLSEEERRLFLLAALLLPLRLLAYNVKANKQQPASAHIIRESLKWRVKEVEGVAALHTQAVDMARVYDRVNGAGRPRLAATCIRHPNTQAASH